MRNLVIVAGLFFMLGMGYTSAAQKKADKVVCFKSDMHCDACEKTLFEHLRFEKGVKALELDHVSNTIRVVYSEGKTNPENLAGSVVKKGYKAESITEEVYKHLVDSVKVKSAGEGK